MNKLKIYAIILMVIIMICLAFDLDDTLLNDNRVISDYTINVLKKCRENNILIALNTARSMNYTRRYDKQILFDYYITDGGAEIYDINFKNIYQRLIDKHTLNELITRIKNDNIGDTISVQTSTTLYTEDYEYQKGLSNSQYIEDIRRLDVNATKMVVRCTDTEYLSNLAQEYNLEFVNYVNSEWNKISNANKATGVKILKELINDLYVVSFGDDIGDIDMLLASDVGVCMINGNKKVLDITKYHTDFTNNEDGVAKYIERNFLK